MASLLHSRVRCFNSRTGQELTTKCRGFDLNLTGECAARLIVCVNLVTWCKSNLASFQKAHTSSMFCIRHSQRWCILKTTVHSGALSAAVFQAQGALTLSNQHAKDRNVIASKSIRCAFWFPLTVAGYVKLFCVMSSLHTGSKPWSAEGKSCD